jgi:hypothetical protein
MLPGCHLLARGNYRKVADTWPERNLVIDN